MIESVIAESCLAIASHWPNFSSMDLITLFPWARVNRIPVLELRLIRSSRDLKCSSALDRVRRDPSWSDSTSWRRTNPPRMAESKPDSNLKGGKTAIQNLKEPYTQNLESPPDILDLPNNLQLHSMNSICRVLELRCIWISCSRENPAERWFSFSSINTRCE